MVNKIMDSVMCVWGLLTCVLGCFGVAMLITGGCFRKPTPPVSFSTPPGQFAFPEKSKDIVYLQDGQTLQLLEDVVVKGRIPFSGDELYAGEVRIKAGSMVVKPKAEGPVQSCPVPPETIVPMPMTREEKVKRFRLAEGGE